MDFSDEEKKAVHKLAAKKLEQCQWARKQPDVDDVKTLDNQISILSSIVEKTE